ncbi:hypothetical protein WJX73_006623 [Symbiochloris irregularis]|uniref:Flagellar associated protein n=1 Tax=Symbiochloris irregularis TaxID=706552 RepID=A0AAW1NV73_9CHLO
MAPPGAENSGKVHRSTRKDAWAARSLRSTFGNQVLGRMATAPACGFGSANRDQAGKCYVSSEVDKAQVAASGGNQSQGAIYRLQDGLGRQVLSTKNSASASRFGTSKRSSMALKTDAPGPGAYKVKSPLGNSNSSLSASAPRTRFATANRDASDKVYLSHEHEKGFVGKDSPGPMAYNIAGKIGKQQLSNNASSPTWKLSTGKRFESVETRNAAAVPGPGQYSLPRALGPQVASNKRSLPVVGFGKPKIDRPQTAPAQFSKSMPALSTSNLNSQGRKDADYRLSTRNVPPAWGFGTGRRLPTYVTDSPGPGEYFA